MRLQDRQVSDYSIGFCSKAILLATIKISTACLIALVEESMMWFRAIGVLTGVETRIITGWVFYRTEIQRWLIVTLMRSMTSKI